ncbi:cytochrome P450 2F2-like [Spinachia spinachia]
MFASIILLLICLVFIVIQLKSRRPKNFPPGPPVWPILGNILDLSLENPLKDFERLRKTYGNVYSLFLGPKPVVVINGRKTIKEALVTKGIDFAGRPQDLFVNDTTQRKGVILADYGTSWKEQRRFALMNLRNFGMGKDGMEERIHGEIQYTVDTLEQSVGKSFSPQNMFHNAASNIICQVLFGKRFEYEDEIIKTVVRCFTENAKIANGPWAMLYDSFPMIRSLPLPFRRGFKNVETCQKIAKSLMNENKQTRVPGEPRDFVDCYLDQLDKPGDDRSSFSEAQLTMYILDLHFAGTDTTSNTLLTGFLYLMNYPHVQERCQQEIDVVLEGKDQPRSEDRNNMPYVQAVIHEIQRVANTVPLSVFHCTTKDTEALFVYFNFHVLGPRMCLGEGLARMELFLFTVTLLRKFKFTWPEDAGEPDFTPVYGVTLTPKPYRMKVQLRVPQKIPN